jgi:dienelactone hydrolase
VENKAILKLLGPFPPKVSLNPQTLEKQDFDSYTRELVEYAVESNERVRAYILIPKEKGKKPAIYCHHQHGGKYELGKSEPAGIAGDPDLAYAKELAERGYVTFAPDAICFGERNWSQIPGTGLQVEYFELATRLVRGKTLTAKALHDISVGIDYLISREEVDNNKIGFIGHSYGGRMAIWAPAFDKRIVVSVSNCGCVTYKNSLGREAGIQMEFCIPGIMEWGDIGDIVRMAEPCSLLISATDNDKWSQGAEDLCNYAKPAFRKGELELKVYKGGHMFTKEMREYSYDFLRRHLDSI